MHKHVNKQQAQLCEHPPPSLCSIIAHHQPSPVIHQCPSAIIRRHRPAAGDRHYLQPPPPPPLFSRSPSLQPPQRSSSRAACRAMSWPAALKLDEVGHAAPDLELELSMSSWTLEREGGLGHVDEPATAFLRIL